MATERYKLPATAIVTGGADGIGAAIARRFLAAGDRVHVCDNRPEPLAAMLAANPGMSGTVADVGRRDDVLALFADAAAAFGADGLGTLVNNVGIGGPRAALEDIDPADWEESLRVNATGTFHCMQSAVRAMKPRGGAAIINISTVSTRTRLPLRTPGNGSSPSATAATWPGTGSTATSSRSWRSATRRRPGSDRPPSRSADLLHALCMRRA